jgi:capsid portal protein
MKITNATELKAFLKANYKHLTDAQYIELMSHTLGVYEHSKPKDLDKLIERIDLQAKLLDELPSHYELPLFMDGL